MNEFPPEPPDAGRHRPGCPRCEALACAERRTPATVLRDGCWHEFDRDNLHALGDHRYCLADDYDKNAHEREDDGPDGCAWAARWRPVLLTQAAHGTDDRPLTVVTVRSGVPVLVGTYSTYRVAGPARTRAGREPGEPMGYAKGRALVVCRLGHLH